ncbi:MAG: hypothetical protein FD189_1831 [Elusimicrobia bacterium]|nr:MAG: hypothetical protein FD154_1974 [Elusimicrobiota bacterium]KAF0154579.1 MAG: hypothetical protein FD189_1831 [Elusimicrobiota bacterium]
MKTLIVLMAMSLPAAAASPTAPAPEEVRCAAEEMQTAYYWLAPELTSAVRSRQTSCSGRRGKLEIPGWLETARPAMLESKAWKDPEEGELSEARLWQDAFSILYEFADKTGRTVPGAAEKAVSPLELEKEYGDIRLRLIMGVDRLYKSGMEKTLAGRASGVLTSFGKALKGLDAATAAMAENDIEGAYKGIGDALFSSRGAFSALTGAAAEVKTAARYEAETRLLPGYRGVSLPLSGSQVLFLSPGDRVDMLVTFDAVMAEDRKEKVTATILQNVSVLKVDKPETSDGTGVVQLLCNPSEAQYAALSLVQGGSIGLARRAKGDYELHPMEIASFRKLFK